jgi:hypothetical protein
LLQGGRSPMNLALNLDVLVVLSVIVFISAIVLGVF